MPLYNGLSINNVNVSIVDNDAPKIVINEIDPDQAGTDAAEFIELYDGGVGNVSLSGYVIVLFNGAAANNASYVSYDLTGKSTDAAGFFVLGIQAFRLHQDSFFQTIPFKTAPTGSDFISALPELLRTAPRPRPLNCRAS